MAAHDRLDGLRQDLPVGVQVGGEARRVRLQLAQALEGGLEGDAGMGQAHPQVTQHGGIRQVALKTGDGQLARQVLQDGVGEAQVALGVLEVDGIDLVGHGRGADLAGDGLLAKIAQGDIAPEVAAGVQEDGVEAGGGVEELRHVVVGLDLGGVGIPGQAQGFDETAGEGRPVHLWVGSVVGVVVAHRAVDLAQQGHLGHLVALAGQAGGDVRQLLAQGGGGGGLAMGAR